ncbi:unnamed protein product, partial [Symbiodinium pilosum]
MPRACANTRRAVAREDGLQWDEPSKMELKHKLGDALIKRYEPIFRQLQQHQQTLSAEQQRIATFAEKAAAAKSLYNKSLAELDRINVSVHEARRQSKEKAVVAEGE